MTLLHSVNIIACRLKNKTIREFELRISAFPATKANCPTEHPVKFSYRWPTVMIFSIAVDSGAG